MPELTNMPILTVAEDYDMDYAIDKEFPLEEIVVDEPIEQLEEVKPTKRNDDIAIVNLDEPFPGFKPLNDPPREDNAEDMLAPVVVEELDPITEVKPIEEKLVVDELVPGSTVRFEEDKAEDKPVQQETDWAKDGDHSKFVAYIVTKKNNIPKHSGETTAGCERALHYLKSLDLEISKAMRTDLKGLIDEQKVDAIRKEIETMTDKLNKQINKLNGKKRKADLEVRLVSRGQCEKCNSEVPMWEDIKNNKMVCMSCNAEVGADSECSECDNGLEKEAGTAVVNLYITPFERAIVSTLINSTVSGGKNINDVFDHLNKKYAFTDREVLSLTQLVADYGYPIFVDRGRVGDKEQDPSDGHGCDFITNYHA